MGQDSYFYLSALIFFYLVIFYLKKKLIKLIEGKVGSVTRGFSARGKKLK